MTARELRNPESKASKGQSCAPASPALWTGHGKSTRKRQKLNQEEARIINERAVLASPYLLSVEVALEAFGFQI